jgi:SagB-type dehydrogenase family enzyme
MMKTPFSLYELYHEGTKLNEISEYEMSRRIAALYEDPDRLFACRNALKAYPYALVTRLPEPPLPADPFHEVVARRRSERRFSGAPVSLAELSYLLRYSYGITGSLPVGDCAVQKLRASPSAGALYPVEIYLVVLSSNELSPGAYHYNVLTHSLELVREGDCRPAVRSAMPAQFSLDQVPLLVVLSAAFEKATHKYGERGYRFCLLDAGHVMQNVCLSSTALRLASYPVGGFREDELDSLLGLSGHDETTLYAAAIGPRARTTDDHETER